MEITEKKINNNYVVRVVDGCHYVTICALSATEVHVSCKKKERTILHRKTTWLQLHANELSAENEISGNYRYLSKLH